MIDFHCHIDLYKNPRQVAQQCTKLGITVLSVTTTPSAWKQTSGLAAGSASIHTALGLHPQIAHERHIELDLFDSLAPTAEWIGEIGLDGAPEWRKSWRVQNRVFEHILLTLSRVGGRVMSIHSRRAVKQVLESLARSPNAGLPILHWFAGTQVELREACKRGYWFSVGMPMLQSAKGRALVEQMPRDRVLTETDGPFVLREGAPCFPWDVEGTAVELAALWCMDQLDLRAMLEVNFAKIRAYARSANS